MSNDAALDALLGAKTIAVVGLDARTHRAAYEVAEYLQSQGYRIIPVPVQQPAGEVLGERAYASLHDIPEHVDIVDVFVRSEHTGPVVRRHCRRGGGGVAARRERCGRGACSGGRPGRHAEPLHEGGTPAGAGAGSALALPSGRGRCGCSWAS